MKRDVEMTVGAVAKRTGVSVRALHHYHALGLLKPSHRTAAGYRLYSVRDLVRLEQIVLLRGLGWSLAEVRRSLRDGPSLLETIDLHITKLRERVVGERRICDRLEHTARRLRARVTPSLDEIVRTIEELIMFDKYFTSEQLDTMKDRRVAEADRIREVEAEWPRLIGEVRAEMGKGTPPDDPRVAELARRWAALVEEFTRGDLAIAKGVAQVLQNEPAARQRTGLDSAIMEYISRASAFRNRGTP